MIGESINFMILGMSTVFSFLLIMILVLRVQSFIIEKFFFDSVSENNTANEGSLNNKKVAIISAAIQKHTDNK